MSLDFSGQIENCLGYAFQEEQLAQRCREEEHRKEALEKRRIYLKKAAELFIEKLYGDIQSQHDGKLPTEVMRERIVEYEARCNTHCMLPDRNEMFCLVVKILQDRLNRGEFD